MQPSACLPCITNSIRSLRCRGLYQIRPGKNPCCFPGVVLQPPTYLLPVEAKVLQVPSSAFVSVFVLRVSLATQTNFRGKQNVDP